MSEGVEQKQSSSWNGDDVLRCGCGAPRKAWKSYCPDCARARRPGWSSLSPEGKRRANARTYLNVYLKRGKVTKKPCADCGSPDVEAHHADYSRPLDVTWLCRECHLKRHGVTSVRRPKCSKADVGKPSELFAFYDSLHRRGITTDSLALKLNVSGGAVRRLISNLRPRRGPIWRGLLSLLNDGERTLLGAVEGSVWSDQRASKQPRWSPEKAAQLSGRTEVVS